MVVVLEFLADFVVSMFSLASGLMGVFLFLLMVLVGWVERKKVAISNKILLFGGMSFLIVWLWTRIAITFGGVPTWLIKT